MTTVTNLPAILAAHRKWHYSFGERGERAELSGAELSGAELSGADLRGANLTGAVLRGAALSRADLTDAVLRGADLRGSTIDPAPAVTGIDAAILAAIGQPGCSLDMDFWHRCSTTHCRAGWAIHLAGAAGAALEDRVGPSAAGALIYAASGSHPVPDWFASDEYTLADLRKRASLGDRLAKTPGGDQ